MVVILDQPRTRRKVVHRLLWPAIITILVVVGLGVSASGRDTRAELRYLKSLGDQVEQLALSGDSLRDVITRLSRIDRTELVTVVDQIKSELTLATALVSEGPPSDRLVSVNALYRGALGVWTEGIEGFSLATLTAADDPESSDALDIMANALVALRAGDTLYADMVVELARSDIPDPIGVLPEIHLLPAEGGVASLAMAYITAARSENNTLALRPGLAISQIVSDPKWAANPSDQVVLPATETVTFTLVITNHGNVISGDERVRMVFKGDAEEITEDLPIAPLQAGQQTTLTFGPVSVVPQGIYEIRAVLLVLGLDANLDDNELSVLFTVNNP